LATNRSCDGACLHLPPGRGCRRPGPTMNREPVRQPPQSSSQCDGTAPRE
jgi:hypothetical protein